MDVLLKPFSSSERPNDETLVAVAGETEFGSERIATEEVILANLRGDSVGGTRSGDASSSGGSETAAPLPDARAAEASPLVDVRGARLRLCRATDLSNRKSPRPDAHALVFALGGDGGDGHVQSRVRRARDGLLALLSSPQLLAPSAPLLVLVVSTTSAPALGAPVASTAAAPPSAAALTREEAIQQLSLGAVDDRPWHVQLASVQSRDGWVEGVHWLADNLPAPSQTLSLPEISIPMLTSSAVPSSLAQGSSTSAPTSASAAASSAVRGTTFRCSLHIPTSADVSFLQQVVGEPICCPTWQHCSCADVGGAGYSGVGHVRRVGGGGASAGLSSLEEQLLSPKDAPCVPEIKEG